MFCGSCGKQIPDGSGFCPMCGASAGGGAPRPAANSAAGPSVAAGPSAAAAQRSKLEAQFKAGSQDAVQAFMVLVKDPVGGLAKSFGMFDSGRAQMVGGIFGLVYALAATIAASLLFSSIMGMFMGGGRLGMGFGSPPFSMYIKIFVAYVGEFAGLVAGCLLVRTLFKGAGDLASDLYIAGASSLPGAVGALAGSLLGQIHFSLLVVAAVFGGCYSVLMLYAGCLQIVKLVEGKAALAVPVVITVGLLAFGILIKVLM